MRKTNNCTKRKIENIKPITTLASFVNGIDSCTLAVKDVWFKVFNEFVLWQNLDQCAFHLWIQVVGLFVMTDVIKCLNKALLKILVDGLDQKNSTCTAQKQKCYCSIIRPRIVIT